ncbi:MAG TPA: hypothetical protein DEA97_21490 [Bacteroidales bacterium]|nr:MAG: hypothetical protein UR43_C0014G0009 [candidate division TM6 bacterium GW2011_GWF2_33_332]HBS89135.1 hypothetical protein [Bacteroidales bacterium]
MKVEILDFKIPEDRTWLLCKGNLLEYLEELKEEFYDFAIQRKIVKNQYLNTLLETIIHKDPIPLITLTYKQDSIKLVRNSEIIINLSQVEILDGLQRTFRLWSYLKAYEIITKYKLNSPSDFAKKLKEKYPIIFETGVISLGQIRKSWGSNQYKEIENYYKNYDVYFSIWVNLNDKKIIEKMLLLNAGQKSVSKTHQFELLFLHIWDDLQADQNFMTKIGVQLFREKEAETNKIKTGNREVGQFVFSSVVVSLLSYLEGSPQRVSTDDLFPPDQSKINDSDDAELYKNVFDKVFIKDFLKHLKEIDAAICKEEPSQGISWFVKDTTLSGVLAAVGKYTPLSNELSQEQIRQKSDESFKGLKEKITTIGFNLQSFQNQYNNLSSRSVNIGNFIRKVVMNYTFDLLSNNKPQNWEYYFNAAKKHDEL